MIELLRRALLLAGFVVAWQHFWFTPPALIGLRQANAQEAAASSRHIAGGPLPEALPRHGYLYLDAADPRVQAFEAPLRASLARTGFLNAYAQSAGRDVELMLFPEPHLSSAPPSVLHPKRRGAWPYALAGLVLYLLLGLKRRRGAHHDPVPLAVLDFVVALLGGLFAGLPSEGWRVLALLPAFLLVQLAARASWSLEATGEGFLFRTLLSFSELPVASAAFRLSADGVERTGLDLRLVDGRVVAIEWGGLVDFLPVYETLRQRGLLSGRPAVYMNG